MQVVEANLKKLLFDYDCVTVPGLGGFIMQAKSSRIHGNRTLISPPSRTPSFNILLNHDDGLLINAIARAGQITYSEAGSQVNTYVKECKKRLALGEKIPLEGIGEFMTTNENGILFQPATGANFHAAYYGMSSVNLIQLPRHQALVRTNRKPVDRKTHPIRNRKPASVKWTLGLTIPVIILLLYGIIFPRSIQDIYTNYSGILTDLLKESPRTSAKEIHALEPLPAIVEYKAGTAAIQATEMQYKDVAEHVFLPAEANSNVSVSVKYYIIGGCFENELNAGKFLNALRQKGYEAEEAGTNKRGHIRISYKSFPEKGAALSYLDKIRQQENASAWLLKY